MAAVVAPLPVKLRQLPGSLLAVVSVRRGYAKRRGAGVAERMRARAPGRRRGCVRNLLFLAFSV